MTLATTKMNVLLQDGRQVAVGRDVGVALQRVFVVGVDQRRVGEAEANDVEGGIDVGDEKEEGEREEPDERLLGQPPDRAAAVAEPGSRARQARLRS